MLYWDLVLSVASNSGLYFAAPSFDEDALRAAASQGGLDFTGIELAGVRTKSELLASLSAALQFPPHFGMNWDALNDCLTDLSWRPATGYVLLCRALRAWLEANPSEGRTAVALLSSTVEHWRQRDVPFFIVIS